MAVAQVQKQRAQGTGTTLTATFGTTPTAGNLLIATAGTADTVTPVNPPSGWSTATENDTGLIPRGGIYYKVAGASEPTGVTVTFGASADGRVHIFEYSGGTWTLDVANNARTTGATNVTTPTLATAQAEELIIATVLLQGIETFGNTWTNGFTQQQIDASSTRQETAHRITTASGSYNTNESWSGGGTAVRASIAAFIVTSSGVEGSASISQAHSLTSTGTKATTGTASLSQSSTLTGQGTKQGSGLAALSQSSSLQAQGTKHAEGQAAISQSHTIAASGEASGAVGGSASITQAHTLHVEGTKATQGQAELTQSVTLSSQGTKGTDGTAALSQSVSLTALGSKQAFGTAAITQASTVTVIGPVSFEPVDRRSSTATPRRTSTAVNRRSTTGVDRRG